MSSQNKSNSSTIKPWILPLIIFSQFCCTSIWFASNAVISNLITSYNLADTSLSYLTSAVQLGFITGTFTFALLMIADRYSPSKIFFTCALLGSIANLGLILDFNTFSRLLALRFATGFFLAGIYPIGMKIAADYFEKGLGRSLGYLVGALVLGTAFPHFLKGVPWEISWKFIIIGTSILAVLGGILMLAFVPIGPYRRLSQKIDPKIIRKIFGVREFRSAAFGYFGHMWELYAFWAFVPVMISLFNAHHRNANLNVSLLSFVIIGIGGLACVLAGHLSQKVDTKKVAYLSLLLSGSCCLISPMFFYQSSTIVFIAFLMIWGFSVVADSPMFSTLVANNALPESKGTALTIVSSIGFAITIISIQILNTMHHYFDSRYIFSILVLGPILGLYFRDKQTNISPISE